MKSNLLAARRKAEGVPKSEPMLQEPNLALMARSVTIWGPSGSPGKSTVAVNLCDQFAQLGMRVLLVDADLVSPSVSLLLGLEDSTVGVSAACKLAREAKLDASELERISVKVSSASKTFTVLPGISGASRWPEVTPSAIEVILRVASQNFDLVVFDVASSLEPALTTPAAAVGRNELTRRLLSNADHAILVAGADPVSLNRMIRQFPDVLAMRSSLPSTLLVNRLRENSVGRQPAKQIDALFQQLVKRRPNTYLWDEPANLDSAIRHGIPVSLVSRRSNFTKQLRALAEQLLG